MSIIIDRGDPALDARDYPGQLMKGQLNDEWLWISTPNKNGTYSWRKFEQISFSGQQDTGFRHPVTNLKVIKHFIISLSGKEYVYDKHGMLQCENDHNVPVKIGKP